jgi:hypothetical protein
MQHPSTHLVRMERSSHPPMTASKGKCDKNLKFKHQEKTKTFFQEMMFQVFWSEESNHLSRQSSWSLVVAVGYSKIQFTGG